jgi:hypothetical protein
MSRPPFVDENLAFMKDREGMKRIECCRENRGM